MDDSKKDTRADPAFERMRLLERRAEELQARCRDLASELDIVRRSELLHRTLAESARDFIFVIDRDDVVRYVNPYGASVLGCEPADVIGRPRRELFPPEVSE
jgi:PAS domain-containing protein